ncbi:MAG: dynamin family protein [Anaerolineae bacterium]|nr:dynamin family protein [Anaerolineae bacterium]
MPPRLLDHHEQDLLQSERSLLDRLGLSLARLEARREDQDRLEQARRQLDELFLLVVVGEFNAGKSAFINALLGETLLEEGATPTTVRVHVLRHGDELSRNLTEADLEVITAPVEWLRDINLVDTPGANAVIQRHQEITEDFVPRSDLVLFVTSADRPFSESERLFLERIRAWGKKVVIVVNKVDILDEADRKRVHQFVAENALKLLGTEPQIFMVSARQALRAKQAAPAGAAAEPANWSASQFEPLERFILDTLDETERLRLKLLNPLGVAAKLRDQYAQVTQARLDILTDDFATIDAVEADLTAFEEDMRRDVQFHLSQIDNTLYQMGDRGYVFIDEWLRINRLFDLMNSAKVREGFEHEVVTDTPAQIERQVSDMIDWMVEREYKQWQAVMEYLNMRADLHKERVIGEIGGSFEINRREFLEAVRRATTRAVGGFDQKTEAAKLAESVQTALTQTALVEVGAIGLGAILVAAVHTLVLDLTGLLFAGTMAALGLYVLPNRRRKARDEMRANVADLQERLHSALSMQFEKELTRSVQEIREAVEPYTRFIRLERQKLTAISADLSGIEQETRTLQAKINGLTAG